MLEPVRDCVQTVLGNDRKRNKGVGTRDVIDDRKSKDVNFRVSGVVDLVFVSLMPVRKDR